MDNEENKLVTDLRFLYENRSDTVDQFLEEALALFEDHLNEKIADYQDRVLEESTQYFKGEIATVLLKTRRQYRKEQAVKTSDHHAW